MENVVLPFQVNYCGRDADLNLLEARALGESIIGASKLYTAVAHYSVLGFVPRGRYRKDFACYARPATTGSWEQLWLIAPLAGEYGIHAHLYNQAISYIFKKVICSLKSIWTRPVDTQQVVEQLSNTFLERSKMDHDLLQSSVGGLIKANDNLASLQEKLINTLPQLADATRPHAKRFVQPVGETCSKIIQFTNTPDESSISESDAEVIRGDSTMEVDAMAEYRVTKISEIDLRTGHCVIDVEGVAERLTGKIADPVLEIPGNIYTSALSNHTGFVVDAKAVRKSGVIKSLYISNSRELGQAGNSSTNE